VALDVPGAVRSKPRDLGRYLRPTRLIPVDGIVRETAIRITRGHASDLSRARAIYDWIVETAFATRTSRAAAWVTSAACSR
jgi:transglutaminase-like putative cysteine protease